MQIRVNRNTKTEELSKKKLDGTSMNVKDGREKGKERFKRTRILTLLSQEV